MLQVERESLGSRGTAVQKKPRCVFATPGITAVTVMNFVQNISLAFEPEASSEGRIFISTLQTGKASCRCVKCLARGPIGNVWLSVSLVYSTCPLTHTDDFGGG